MKRNNQGLEQFVKYVNEPMPRPLPGWGKVIIAVLLAALATAACGAAYLCAVIGWPK